MIGGMASLWGRTRVEWWALATAARTASGMPRRVTTRCYVDPGLPRSTGLGPVCAPPFGLDAEAVHAHPPPIDSSLVAEPVEQPRVQPLPDSGRLPVGQPPSAGGAAPTAQLFRHQPPRAACAQDEADAAEGGTVGDTGAITPGLGRLLRQQRYDGFPKLVEDQGFLHHGTDDVMPGESCNTF